MYVTFYSLEYSEDGHHWESIEEDGSTKVSVFDSEYQYLIKHELSVKITVGTSLCKKSVHLKSISVNVLTKLQTLKVCCLNYVGGYEVSIRISHLNNLVYIFISAVMEGVEKWKAQRKKRETRAFKKGNGWNDLSMTGLVLAHLTSTTSSESRCLQTNSCRVRKHWKPVAASTYMQNPCHLR